MYPQHILQANLRVGLDGPDVTSIWHPLRTQSTKSSMISNTESGHTLSQLHLSSWPTLQFCWLSCWRSGQQHSRTSAPHTKAPTWRFSRTDTDPEQNPRLTTSHLANDTPQWNAQEGSQTIPALPGQNLIWPEYSKFRWILNWRITF